MCVLLDFTSPVRFRFPIKIYLILLPVHPTSEQIGYRCKKFASSAFCEQFVSMNLVNFRMHKLSSIFFLSFLFIF